MTTLQVIRELLSQCADVLYERLGEGEYTEFLRGNVTFRLDLIRKPEKILANVDLPGKNEPRLKIEFKRPYTRLIERVNAEQD
jgi:hypothetical protein